MIDAIIIIHNHKKYGGFKFRMQDKIVKGIYLMITVT